MRRFMEWIKFEMTLGKLEIVGGNGMCLNIMGKPRSIHDLSLFW